MPESLDKMMRPFGRIHLKAMRILGSQCVLYAGRRAKKIPERLYIDVYVSF